MAVIPGRDEVASSDVQLHIRESISPRVYAARWIPGLRPKGTRPGMTAATIGVSIPPQFQSCPVHPDFLKIDVICFTVSDARRDGPESSLNFGKTSSQ
ncbi:hypothetical protein [Bradyrhizobium neotropicale]|uniref:hypothetical protein n=1 Tax=Bradyrhizobium neotropicale TaxID=1497615 RepID=UPI001AD7B6FF|nr:hypothetical protein [Bradyrhizobium neotropicale]MBO4224185.1 hypothetical protein [Bradyrhizobium neotropicale]